MTPEQKLAAIAAIFETKTPIPGSKSQRSTHAYYNLEGAIIDIEHSGGVCDAVSLMTLRRVSTQLARIGRLVIKDEDAVEDSCGCVFCDLELPTHFVAGKEGRYHETLNGDFFCTRPMP